ncbi:MAG: NAD-binding protein, partial [Abditibacteriales bacterium]|nr:NAD-binding protein [Abditibacteriales bacterium]MDW8364350.1 NAD-binding protein [Abditibacteriales bacterium]
MYIIIVGVGKVGYSLAKDLIDKGHEVTVIEARADRHSRAVNELGCVAILGMGNDPSVLEEAGIERADVLVACTGHDEDNLVISHIAKILYPKTRVVARVNHPKNED